jgi:hypothetical protein
MIHHVGCRPWLGRRVKHKIRSPADADIVERQIERTGGSAAAQNLHRFSTRLQFGRLQGVFEDIATVTVADGVIGGAGSKGEAAQDRPAQATKGIHPAYR